MGRTRHASVEAYVADAPEPLGGLLEGTGKKLRHVKVRPGEPFPEADLRGLLAEAFVEED